MFAWIFQKWARINSLADGFSGFLHPLSIELMFYSMVNQYTPILLFVDRIVKAILLGIFGGMYRLGSGQIEKRSRLKRVLLKTKRA